MVSVTRLHNISVVRLLFSFTFGVYEYYVLALCFALLFLVCFFVFCDEFLLLLFCCCLCCLFAVLFLLWCVFVPSILCFGWPWASNELLAGNVIVTCDFFCVRWCFFDPFRNIVFLILAGVLSLLLPPFLQGNVAPHLLDPAPRSSCLLAPRLILSCLLRLIVPHLIVCSSCLLPARLLSPLAWLQFTWLIVPRLFAPRVWLIALNVLLVLACS